MGRRKNTSRHSTPIDPEHHPRFPPRTPTRIEERDKGLGLTSFVQEELRSHLDSFLRLRREWDGIVLSRGLATAVNIVELEAEIDSTVKNACFVDKCREDQVKLKSGYAWKQFLKLDAQKSTLLSLLHEMFKITQSFQELNDLVESLVQRSSQTFGTLAVFETPVWTTWPLPRFGDYLVELAGQFHLSLSLKQILVGVITSDKPDPAEKQAALSYWACQPLLYDKVELEELLAAEVPGLASHNSSFTPSLQRNVGSLR